MCFSPNQLGTLGTNSEVLYIQVFWLFPTLFPMFPNHKSWEQNGNNYKIGWKIEQFIFIKYKI